MTYSEKLRDPRWQKKRLRIMEYAGWRCQICGAKDNTLHCHHSYYGKKKEPWQYPDGSIICICQPCHEKIHGVKPVQPTSVGGYNPGPPVTEEYARAQFRAMREMLERKSDSGGNAASQSP